MPGLPSQKPAVQKKERTYPELAQSGRCRLVVLGVETGGRFSTETTTFLRLVAEARSHDAPPVLRTMARSAWITRWSALLGHAAHQAFAASLLLEDTASTANIDGDPPPRTFHRQPPVSPFHRDGLAVWTCVFPSTLSEFLGSAFKVLAFGLGSVSRLMPEIDLRSHTVIHAAKKLSPASPAVSTGLRSKIASTSTKSTSSGIITALKFG